MAIEKRTSPTPVAGPSFTVAVEGFGPIASGSVTMAPLTVLVGKNSTGKSYMASLLWALMAGDIVMPRTRRHWRTPTWFTELLGKIREGSASPDIEIEIAAAEAWINQNLEENQERELQRLFSSNSVTARSIRLVLAEQAPIRMHLREWNDDEEDEDGDRPLASWSAIDGVTRFAISELQYASGPFMSAVQRAMFGPRRTIERPEAVYLPAARTGLILALDSLVETSLGSLAPDSLEARTTLPLPTVRFLQQLSQRSTVAGTYARVADFLEQSVLSGSIGDGAETDRNTPEFYFESDASGHLPLFVTSSMVTEVAPIAVLMRRMNSRYFVIEEPEAHLHLGAQRDMARAIARLVNAGAQVVVTTHSDTFLQQLNLLIALGSGRPELADFQQQHGYRDEELLSPDIARCFEFVQGPTGTTIEEAQRTEDGFVVRTINEPLLSLADEVLALQAADDAP